jgi:hypothetical protein
MAVAAHGRRAEIRMIGSEIPNCAFKLDSLGSISESVSIAKTQDQRCCDDRSSDASVEHQECGTDEVHGDCLAQRTPMKWRQFVRNFVACNRTNGHHGRQLFHSKPGDWLAVALTWAKLRNWEDRVWDLKICRLFRLGEMDHAHSHRFKNEDGRIAAA